MRRCLLFLIAFVLLFDMFSGFAFAQNYDDEQLTLNIATSCSAMEYNAGKPIVFTVEILDGNPPFQYSWELGETFNYSSRSLLEEYICNDAFVVSLPHGTTYSRRIEFTYTPPVLGHDLTAVCYIVDRDGRDVEAHVGAFSPISWATTYAQFVLDGGFLYDDYLPNTQLGVSAFYDNELNEIDDLYNSWRPLSFSLYDMNNDSIPELLMDVGGDYALGSLFVFTYQNHSMQYAGSLGYHEFIYPYVSVTPGMPGIYHETGNMGTFYTLFSQLEDNKLNTEILFNESHYIGGEDNMQWTDDAIVTWETTNQAIINDWNSSGHKLLLFYPLEYIQKLGWWNEGFLEQKFLGSGQDQTVINTISSVSRLLESVQSRDSILGYGYYKSLPSDWLATIMWTDFFQGHVSSLDMSYNRQRFLFTEAIQMCTTNGKKSKFVNMKELPDGLVLMNKELKFQEAAYAQTVKNLCDPDILKRNNLNTAYFDKLISDTVDGKRSYLDTQQDLDLLGMSSADVEDIMESINMVDTIHVAGKMAKTYSNAKKAWNSVAEIANKWSLLNALDKNQMLQIAASYRNGSSDMQAIAEILDTFARADKAGQIALVTSDKVMKLGLDYLFDFLSATMMKEMAKVAGGVATAGYAVTYAAIDFLTGVGDLTSSYSNLIFAGETVDHFWNNVRNYRDNLGVSPSESNMLRAAYAYINYYTAAAELDEKYYDLVQTGDSAILSNNINNDAMRQESARAKEQAPELRKKAEEMLQILIDSGLLK